LKELNLPVIREYPTELRTLSMDEYLDFIQFNLKHAFDKKAYTKWKKMLIVDVQFVLK